MRSALVSVRLRELFIRVISPTKIVSILVTATVLGDVLSGADEEENDEQAGEDDDDPGVFALIRLYEIKRSCRADQVY